MLATARDVLAIEAQAVAAAADGLDGDFVRACELILACQGRLVVSGMGKSGHVASKIAATFASTGTPAFFVHPAEASHGDLGMITAQDVVLCLSNSGSTEELVAIVPLIKRRGAGLIAMTGNPSSRLAGFADVHIDASVRREACPLNLAPTASTTTALALGDALAVAVLEARGFDANDFARSHPGGALGRRLLTRVRDLMHQGAAVPAVTMEVGLGAAIMEMTRKRLGMTAVLDTDQKLAGILTDGDLRRLLERNIDVRELSAADAMTRSPATIQADALAAEALHLMESRRIGQLLVLDDEQRLVGALNFQDLLAAKIA
ncbi:MAG: KpsF/GutQ family sugar-phosphate isomerase [Burkholderiaceae bacterium]